MHPQRSEFVFPVAPRAFVSLDEYRSYCDSVAAINPRIAADDQPEFYRNRAIISAANEDPSVIKTSWGGVVITFREDPKVEKFLVVDQGKYLKFEVHQRKVETLEVREGLGILVFRPLDSQDLQTLRLEPGVSITLQPGQEHCIIASSNLLVFEKSMDHLGMDRDLTFIFEP